MSISEVLEAIRRLPREEKIRLLHVLIDETSRPDLPADDVIQRALFMDAIRGPQGAGVAAALSAALEAAKNGTSGI